MALRRQFMAHLGREMWGYDYGLTVSEFAEWNSQNGIRDRARSARRA